MLFYDEEFFSTELDLKMNCKALKAPYPEKVTHKAALISVC